MSKSKFEKTVDVLADRAGFIRFGPDEDPRTPIDWSSDYSEELAEFALLMIGEAVRLIEHEIEFHQDMETSRKHFEQFKETFQEHFGVANTKEKTNHNTWRVW